MPRIISYTEQEYIKNKSKISGTCWEWVGSKDKDGYGKACYKFKRERAHRLSYRVFKLQDISNMLVLHTCDNPSCVNPEHLFLGTHKDNMLDKKTKGRQLKGEEIGNSKLKESDIFEIRKLRATRSLKELSKQFNCSVSNIHDVCKGYIWQHL